MKTFFVILVTFIFASTNVNASDKSLLTKNIQSKLSELDATSLSAVNDFVDKLWEIKANPKKKIVVLAWEKDTFPHFLKKFIVGKLSSVPITRKSLQIFENEKTGTENVYVKVPAKYVPKGTSVLEWIPRKNGIDFQANGLSDRPKNQALLSLFYFGNKKLVEPIKKYNWDWSKLPHPDDTPEKAMYIPVATLPSGMSL